MSTQHNTIQYNTIFSLLAKIIALGGVGVIGSISPANADWLDERPLHAWKADLYWSANTNKGKDSYNAVLGREGVWIGLGLLQRFENDGNKERYPLAPKDDMGNYYLELNGDQKAVKVPSPWGVNLYVNLEHIAFAKEESYFRILSTPSIFPDNLTYGTLRIPLVAVTSAKQFPNFATVTDTGGYTTDHFLLRGDQGGGFVGVQSVVFGPEESVKTTICGKATEPTEMKLDILENGILVGHWRAQYAIVPSCEAGDVKIVAIAKGKAAKESSFTVNFK